MTPDAPDGVAAEAARADIRDLERLLEAGGRSGDYRVLQLLGAGGLGTVYKALDTRLHRPVAIKTLGAAGHLSERAGARLRSEALAAASLDHPYICKIYELIDTGSVPLIVMEYLEGETLAALLSRGVPPLDVSVRVGLEIAEGLAAAHAHGLVHRDVKPANVMITPHGHVKLLDFGLALPDTTSDAAAETQVVLPASDVHAGTPRYMSPEQAAGRPITARADVFSLGIVLFESLSGALPFRGDSAYEYMKRLQTSAPARLDRLVPALPPPLVGLVEQCLEKAPADRPDSPTVVRTLRDVLNSLSATSDSRRRHAVRRWRAWLWLPAAGAVGLVAYAAYSMRPTPPLAQWTSRPFVSTSADESASRISPDGRWLSFISSAGGVTELKVQRLDSGAAQRVEVAGGLILSHVWSPDGNQIACILRQASSLRLVVVPAFFGGAPVSSQVLADSAGTFKVLRWIGRWVYVQVSDRGGRSLFRVDTTSGTIEQLSQQWRLAGAPGEFDVRPRDERVVFSMAAGGREDLWTAALDGTSMVRATDDEYFERDPMWSADGDAVIYQSNRGGQVDLWETSLSMGASRPLTSSPTLETPDAMSADGRLVSFQQTAEVAHLWLWQGDAARQLTDDARADVLPSLSRAGDRVVFQRTRPVRGDNPAYDADVFVAALQGTGTLANVRQIGEGFAPLLSPDGRHVAFLRASPDQTRGAIYVHDLQSDRSVQVASAALLPGYSTFPAGWTERHFEWTPTGEALIFIEDVSGWAVRRVAAGEAGAETLVKGEAGEIFHGLSVAPNGRITAFLVNRRGTTLVRFLDMDTNATRDVQLTGPGAAYLRAWLDDDRGVVVLRQRLIREDRTADLDVTVISPQSGEQIAARLDHALLPTVRVDPSRAGVYVTRVEAGVHNGFVLSLPARTLRRVTSNTLPGATFSGYTPLANGALMGVLAERTSDIWLMEIAPR